MRAVVVVALCTSSTTTAHADFEASARIGQQATELDNRIYQPYELHFSAQGGGPLVDVEVGWAIDKWSFDLFGAYSSMSNTYQMGDGGSEWDYTLTHRFVDIGVRSTLHVDRSVFVGAGLAGFAITDRGSVGHAPSQPGTMLSTTTAIDSRDGGVALEIHGGFLFPDIIHCSCRVELFGAISQGWASNDREVTSGRLAIGVELR